MKTRNETIVETKDETQSIARLLLLAALAFVIPLSLFALERMTGVLPSATDWIANGSNHGPWRNSWQGFTLYLPILAALATLIVGLRHLFRNHYTRSIRCLGLAIVQGGSWFALLILIGWTID